MHSKQTVLNGVPLPREFSGGSIINNVAISRDGSKYAVVGRDKQIITGDVPDNGVLEIDGTKITIGKGGRGVSISGRGGSSSVFSSTSFGGVVIGGGTFGGVVIGGGNISIGGSVREAEVDQSFVGVREVIVQTTDADLRFRVHDATSVKVEGAAVEKPSVHHGMLDLGDFEGVIYLPRTGVKVAAKTMSGDIDGDISSEGSLKTMSGDISLKLSGPIAIRTQTMSGDVDVRGMMSAGRNTFEPPSGNVEGNLSLETMSGDVTVKYNAR